MKQKELHQVLTEVFGDEKLSFGQFDCKCSCCLHWRRRTHALAAKFNKLLGRKQFEPQEITRDQNYLRRLYRIRCDELATLKKAAAKAVVKVVEKTPECLLCRMLKK